MSKHYFFSDNGKLGIFEIEGESFKDACDGLEFELQMHDNWMVIPGKKNKAHVYFKGKLYETMSHKKLTETQEKLMIVLEKIEKETQRAMDAEDIGFRMTPKLNKIAVTSSLRSLEKMNLVGRLSPKDRWTNAKWFIK